MKPFKIMWDNKSLFPHKTRIIGVGYNKGLMLGKIGILNILTIWYWKKYRSIRWVSK